MVGNMTNLLARPFTGNTRRRKREEKLEKNSLPGVSGAVRWMGRGVERKVLTAFLARPFPSYTRNRKREEQQDNNSFPLSWMGEWRGGGGWGGWEGRYF